MSITIRPPLEDELRARAEAAGISVEAYLQELLRREQNALDELESLAIEGLNSGDAKDLAPSDWEEKHRKLDARLGRNQRP
jgi:hypothetical protein